MRLLRHAFGRSDQEYFDRPSTRYPKSFILLIVLLIITICPGCTTEEEVDYYGIFEEDKGFLQIPGVGWQTFYRTAQDDPTLAGLPFESGCAYVRWDWSDLEPEEGQYSFAMIDDWLERCRESNQALAFRVFIMAPENEDGIPQWLIDKGIKYTYLDCYGRAHYDVDIEEPIVSELHEKLIRALGERYDGHPDLALVDIGSVGLWGEWHNRCGLMPSDAARKAIIDLYYEAFPNTPLTALVEDKPNALYANSKGSSAWRGDCWGDGEGPGVEWNHHEDHYWPMADQMPDGWKTGTVAFESCYTLGYLPTPPETVVGDAIAWHATFAHNKGAAIPEAWLPEIKRLVMKMGFRLALRNITYEKEAGQGSVLHIRMNWENLGIAPPYRDHRITFRLKNDSGENKAVEITETSILGWLPGEKEVNINYAIPSDLTAGNYVLEMGIVFHSSIEHVIPIANYGITDDGWYFMGNLEVIR